VGSVKVAGNSSAPTRPRLGPAVKERGKARSFIVDNSLAELRHLAGSYVPDGSGAEPLMRQVRRLSKAGNVCSHVVGVQPREMKTAPNWQSVRVVDHRYSRHSFKARALFGDLLERPQRRGHTFSDSGDHKGRYLVKQ
jgi:hypothetical protein